MSIDNQRRMRRVLSCMARDYTRHAERQCKCSRVDRRAYYGGDPR